MNSKMGFIFVTSFAVLSIVMQKTASDDITPENKYTLDMSYWEKQPDSYVEDYDGNIRHRGVIVTDPNAYRPKTYTIARSDEYISLSEMKRRFARIKAEIQGESNDEPESLYDGSASIADMNKEGDEAEKNEEPESVQDRSISITDVNKESVEADRNEEHSIQHDTITNRDIFEAENNENFIPCNEVTPNSAMDEVLPPTPDHGPLQISHDRPLDLSEQINSMRERRDDLKGLLAEFDEARSDAKIKDILSGWNKEKVDAERSEEPES